MYIVITNVTGMYVECRMAPLSKALTGVVLNHDACGTHLDDSGCTRDIELEKENFRVAGKVLADIWIERELDKRLVIAEYVENVNDVIWMILMKCGSHNIAEFCNICFRL